MFIIFAMPRTNEGDYLHRSLKNCCGVEPQQFLAKNFTQAHNYPKRKWQHRHTFLNSTKFHFLKMGTFGMIFCFALQQKYMPKATTFYFKIISKYVLPHRKLRLQPPLLPLTLMGEDECS